MPGPAIIQWVVDTRTLWPEVTETKQLETFPSAARALAVLPAAERAAVLRYVFARDAKMSLASHLLKHYVVSKLGGVAWQDATVTRDSRTKPVYVDPRTGKQPVAFNVTHQAGIVAVAAVAGQDDAVAVDVGVDVVCTSERRARDHKMVDDDGWPAFVDMHAEVLAPAEVDHLKHSLLAGVAFPPGTTPDELLDYRLRCFYTLWCLREAYVKMTGEALLASWLRDLEFRGFQPPPIPKSVEVGDLGQSDESVMREQDIWFQGNKVDDANVCLRSLGSDFMVCTAVRTPGHKEYGLGWELGKFEVIMIDAMVYFAERQC